MTVGELVTELLKQNQNADISVITIGKNSDWEYTSTPKIKSHKNSFGETVWIQ